MSEVDPSLSEIRYEIAELVADGLIEPTGEFRPRSDGTLAPVYRITELGRQEAEAVGGDCHDGNHDPKEEQR